MVVVKSHPQRTQQHKSQDLNISHEIVHDVINKHEQNNYHSVPVQKVKIILLLILLLLFILLLLLRFFFFLINSRLKIKTGVWLCPVSLTLQCSGHKWRRKVTRSVSCVPRSEGVSCFISSCPPVLGYLAPTASPVCVCVWLQSFPVSLSLHAPHTHTISSLCMSCVHLRSLNAFLLSSSECHKNPSIFNHVKERSREMARCQRCTPFFHMYS